MYLYRATSDPFYLEVGEDMLRSIQHSAKTECGYATIKNVKDHRKEDRMESFFLAETLKYLYLLFDSENFIHNNGREGHVLQTPNGECIIESGGFVFNTEAHPIDPGALRCCSEVPRENIFESYDPDIVIGNFLSEKPKQKKTDKVPKLAKEPLIEHLEITIAELQQFLENARKIEEQTRGASTSQDTADDSLVQAIGQVDTNTKEKSSDEVYVNMTISSHTIEETQNDAKEKLQNNDRMLSDEDNNSKQIRINEHLPVAIVKLPSTLDSDFSNTTPEKTTATISHDLPHKKTNYTVSEGTTEEIVINNLVNGTGVSDSITNTSVFQEFVQTIIKATTHPSKSDFDPQAFLENVRSKNVRRNESWAKEHHLLTCRQQPFLQRMAVLGQFFY